jgi:stage V sporulation protein AC
MGKNMVWAFLVGGLICVLGQGLTDWYRSLGLGVEAAGTATSVTLIFLTALLTGVGIFDTIAKHAGAGTLVPITGFANAVVSPAMEFKSEGFVTGTAVKLFTVAGPVLTYGLSASVVYGLILWLVRLA